MKLAIGKVLQAKGVSQTRLAEALGLSTSYISLLVSNRRKPSHEVLLRMANFLQVTVNDLFADEDEGLLEQPQIQQDPVQLDDEIIAQLDLLTEQEKQLLLAAARGFVSQRRGEGR